MAASLSGDAKWQPQNVVMSRVLMLAALNKVYVETSATGLPTSKDINKVKASIVKSHTQFVDLVRLLDKRTDILRERPGVDPKKFEEFRTRVEAAKDARPALAELVAKATR